MDTTPELPPEIRDFTDPEKTCTNVYQILPNETKLYGTESLVDENGVPEPSWNYGYWETAELLLLAQDPSNLNDIQKRLGNHPDPFGAFDWRFDKRGRPQRDGHEANRNIHWLAQQIDCRKLYGSAYVGLLKHGNTRTHPPPKGSAVKNYQRDVLRWVLNPARTPHLRAIACLGTKARDLVANVLIDRIDRRRFKTQPVGSSVRIGQLYIIYLMHPSPLNHWRDGFGPGAWPNWRKLAVECEFPILPPPWHWDPSLNTR